VSTLFNEVSYGNCGWGGDFLFILGAVLWLFGAAVVIAQIVKAIKSKFTAELWIG
jgi:hypothetical protein